MNSLSKPGLLVKVRTMPLLFTRFLLVIALLFVQTGSLTHGISHTLADQNPDQSLPHDKHCDLCAAYAQVGSAIGSESPHFVTSESFETPPLALFSLPATFSFFAFSARAPPRSA